MQTFALHTVPVVNGMLGGETRQLTVVVTEMDRNECMSIAASDTQSHFLNDCTCPITHVTVCCGKLKSLIK